MAIDISFIMRISINFDKKLIIVRCEACDDLCFYR